MHRPEVLFVCVHNAGRSQMAAAWLAHLAGDAVVVRSAGTAPAETINPAVIEVMAEVGIDVIGAGATPKRLEDAMVEASDVVVTMGVGIRARTTPAPVTRTGPSTTRPDRTPRSCAPSVTRSGPGLNACSGNSELNPSTD